MKRMRNTLRRMRKGSALTNVCLSLLIVGLAPGCSQNAQKVTIRGSNTIGEELAPRLISEYQKEHPGVTFDVEFKGTSYGLGALMVARCNIAAASRETTTNELVLAKDRDITFSDHIIGSYSVAVIVNAGSSVRDLTPEQVRDIFTGAVQNWKDVGGPDAPIHLYVRDPISGTHIGFQELAMEKKPYSLGIKTFPDYAGIANAVAQDVNGVGYSGIDLSPKQGVRPVTIHGVPPIPVSVNEGRYPYSRTLRLYTDKSTESPVASDFIQFVQSRRGQEILTQMGFVSRQ